MAEKTRIRGRNMDGIQHEALRKKLDDLFYRLSDELDDAYYNHWRHGNSHDWLGLDLSDRGNPKAAFDVVHGAFWHIYNIVFHEVAQLDPDGPLETEYNAKEVDPGAPDVIRDEDILVRKDEFARQWLRDHLTAQQLQWIKDNWRPRIKQWVLNNLGHDIQVKAD